MPVKRTDWLSAQRPIKLTENSFLFIFVILFWTWCFFVATFLNVDGLILTARVQAYSGNQQDVLGKIKVKD